MTEPNAVPQEYTWKRLLANDIPRLAAEMARPVLLSFVVVLLLRLLASSLVICIRELATTLTSLEMQTAIVVVVFIASAVGTLICLMLTVVRYLERP